MTYVLDTNILLTYLRGKQLSLLHGEPLHLLLESNTLVISVVSLGELKSLAIRNGWGESRLKDLDAFAAQFLIADIHNKAVIDRYAEIDAFSQGKHPTVSLTTSSRNMGKNDLWIAATASVLQATLVTMDTDFDHLHHILNLDILRVATR